MATSTTALPLFCTSRGLLGRTSRMTASVPHRFMSAAGCSYDDPRIEPLVRAWINPQLASRQPFPAAADMSFPMVEALNEMLVPRAAAGADAGWEIPELDGVERTERAIEGPDGDTLSMQIHRPLSADSAQPLACVLHIHGGLWYNVNNRMYSHWRDSLALQGVVAIGVDRRNPAPGDKLYNHYSRINADVLANLEWVSSHKDQLGISTVVANGESMGGKLALTLAISLKRRGKLDLLDGIYAQCPYASGRIQPPSLEFPSLLENDDIQTYMDGFGRAGQLAGVFLVEGPHASQREDPLCWPYEASEEDLIGWPETVISVNECDTLRDMGTRFYQKLKAAGVPGYCLTLAGHHGQELYHPKLNPELHRFAVREIAGFAKSL